MGRGNRAARHLCRGIRLSVQARPLYQSTKAAPIPGGLSSCMMGISQGHTRNGLRLAIIL